MNDTSEPDSARDRMIAEQLALRGIVDARVLDAMRKTPRERFLDPEQARDAYRDMALPIAGGQTTPPPCLVALMTQAAAIEPGDRVLEVGAGSGYGAAVLSRLAARVWAIERLPPLARRAGANIAELGLANVTVLRGDGAAGWPPAAPFNAIIVAASCAEAPETLRRQLAIGGRMIVPVGPPNGPQRLVRIVRKDAESWRQEDMGPINLAPLA